MTSSVSMPSVGPGEILPYSAARHGDKTALVVGSTRLTYRELDRLSAAVAAALRQHGIGAGDVVSLYGQNSWQWIVSYHGILRSGAVVNPVNVMLTAPELAYVLRDCGARALFAGTEQVGVAGGVLADVPGVDLFVALGESGFSTATGFSDLVSAGEGFELAVVGQLPGDLCAIGYTSGTTGHPKGAMQSQQAILLNCALTATMHGRTDRDTVVTALPAAHVYGNVAINATFLAGGTVVLMERFDARTALELIDAERATMFEGVPAMYSMMLADPALGEAELSSLRVSTVGGQTFSVEVLHRWQERTAAPMLELWGMTEIAGLGSTHSVYAPPCPGSIGVALPGVELSLARLGGDMGPVPPGEPGELLVRGPLVMLGYYGRPDATAEALDSDGWLHTGDVAYVDDTGHYFVVDRLKDVIITGGYNVYPAEIERVLAAHPAVAMVAVGRRPDEVRGEIAVAYIVLTPGHEPDEGAITTYCRHHLAAYKRPRAVVFVDVLPTTSSGKLMRRKLSELDPATQPAR